MNGHVLAAVSREQLGQQTEKGRVFRSPLVIAGTGSFVSKIGCINVSLMSSPPDQLIKAVV